MHSFTVLKEKEDGKKNTKLLFFFFPSLIGSRQKMLSFNCSLLQHAWQRRESTAAFLVHTKPTLTLLAGF